jgi:hypothetical protein
VWYCWISVLLLVYKEDLWSCEGRLKLGWWYIWQELGQCVNWDPDRSRFYWN